MFMARIFHGLTVVYVSLLNVYGLHILLPRTFANLLTANVFVYKLLRLDKALMVALVCYKVVVCVVCVPVLVCSRNTRTHKNRPGKGRSRQLILLSWLTQSALG